MGPGFTDENRPGRIELADAMMGYVRNFAHTGVPSAPDAGLPEWAPWSNEAGGPKLIELDADPERAIVRMGREELTVDDVRTRLGAMPERVRETARRGLRAFA